MADASVPVWVAIAVPITTLVGGFVLNMVGDVARDQRALNRERAARESARQRGRDDFQRQTILDLQVAMTRFVRNAVDYVTSAKQFASDEATNPLFPLKSPQDLFVEMDAERAQIVTLRARIVDEELRRLVQEFQATVERYVFGWLDKHDEGAARQSAQAAHQNLVAVNERINVLLIEKY